LIFYIKRVNIDLFLFTEGDFENAINEISIHNKYCEAIIIFYFMVFFDLMISIRDTRSGYSIYSHSIKKIKDLWIPYLVLVTIIFLTFLNLSIFFLKSFNQSFESYGTALINLFNLMF
jgi:hypothetical protein